MKNLKNKTFTLLFSFVSIFSYSQYTTSYFNSYKENIKGLEKSAKNSPEGQRALAEYYYSVMDYSKGAIKEYRYDKAYEWFLKAAENNDAKSQYRVASMYKTGEGIEKDKQKMWFWLSKSAENGFAVAQLEYAGFSCNFDFKQNPQKQEYWLKKAAEQDYQPAQFYLAQFYQHGQSTLSEEINVDKSKALLWYLKVAQSNLYVNESAYGIYDDTDYVRQAQTRVGQMYFKGEGTNVDIEKAIFWSTKSIEKLDAGMTTDIKYSMINLGDIYFYLKDFDKALYWYNTLLKSSYGPYSDAKEKILEVEKAIASRKEEANAKSQGKEVLAELYKKRQEETEEKNRLNEQRDKAQEEFTKRINAEWDANAAKSKAMDAAVAKAHREAQKENKSFIQELIPDLQKTEQAVNQKIKENDAAFRGTTVEAEKEKAQREAAFYEITERNAANSNASNSSNDSNSSSSNDINTNNNNLGTDYSNTTSSNNSSSGNSNSTSKTTSNNVSNGSNSSTKNSSNNKYSPSGITLTVVDNSKDIARQKEAELRGAIIQKAQLRQLELDKENYDKEVKKATERRLNIEKWNKEGEEMRKRPYKSNNVPAKVISK